MFFLKKLLQYIEGKGFRAGTDGADKRSVAIAAPAKPAGRAVRRENGEQGFSGNRRGRVAAESAYAAAVRKRNNLRGILPCAISLRVLRGASRRSAARKGNAFARHGAGMILRTARYARTARFPRAKFPSAANPFRRAARAGAKRRTFRPALRKGTAIRLFLTTNFSPVSLPCAG